ncbi:hypothetical protein OIV83_001505 [Microbotryomycetes sp. JL201]|nr:hypothetical protein OIV83_001505 [Microbotryomycetes sp. JL201]
MELASAGAPPITMSAKESFEEQFGPLLAGTLDMFQLGAVGTDNTREDASMPEPDVDVIYRAEHKVKEFHRRGKELVDSARDDVRALARHFQQAQANASRATGQATAADHEASMQAAQAALLAGLKTNKQMEQALYRYQADLARLQQENIDEEADAADAAELNSDVLRIKMYRDMGFTPLEEDGLFRKMLVRSQNSTEARTVAFETTGSNSSNNNNFFWSSYLWDAVSA